MGTARGSFKTVSAPIKARKDPAAGDTLHGIWVPDPYRYMEDQDSPEVLAWAHAQEDRFAEFVKDHDVSKQRAFLTGIWDYPKKSIPSRYGKKWFDSYNPGLAPQSIIRVYDDGLDSDPRTLIDPIEWHKDGLIALKGTSISFDGSLMVYKTSESGSDVETVHIMDVETGEDLPDIIENCRWASITWDKDSTTGFHYTYPQDPSDPDNKSFVVKHHTIGDDIANDPLVFETAGINNAICSLSRPRHGEHEWAYNRIGTNNSFSLHVRPIGSTSPFTKIFDEGFADITVIGEIDGYIYMATDHDASRSKLVRFKLDAPEPENWETIIPEHSEDLLQGVFLHKGLLYARYSHDCADEMHIFKPDGTPDGKVPIPPQSLLGFGRVNKDDDNFRISISNFQEAGGKYKYDLDTRTLELYEESALQADLKHCIVERIRVPSKDGTLVPMSLIRHPDTKLDGTAALKLYGYGGFNSPLSPSLSFGTLNWVNNGGIYVQTNLRGGGEFGSEWYDGGRLHNKQNTFDDFIACAEYLIDNDYTSPDRLVSEGGSNGGLLTAATMLQRPDLFGAVISDVAVTDMLRYHLSTYGGFWKSDYGNPSEDKADFDVSMAYSPLHNVVQGAEYPPILLSTADHDDRVVPAHSYKFAATLQAEASPDNLVMLSVEKNAGHGAGKPTEKVIDEMLKKYAFIEKAIGPIDQNAYKATLDASTKPAKKPAP